MKIIALTFSIVAALGCAGCKGIPRPVPPPGFQTLFTGVSLHGWRGLPGDPPALEKMLPYHRIVAQREANTRMREHWRNVNGVLVFDGQGENLCTLHDYGDFELLLDWRIPAGGDSGVYIRGCPQVQIWDNPAGSGGLYNNRQNVSKPLAVADKPAGEWNTFRIRIVGDRVTVHLNDVLVVNDTPMENSWDRGKPLPTHGSIELQAHGGPLEFRNIFIRELSKPLVTPPVRDPAR